jgi:alkyl sulfatase BDS1-like metallo-beta-lactamase superfamily hydrolase
MICLSYLNRGEELYKKTNNLEAFSGNFDKGNNYFPKYPSSEFKNKYSNILVTLANAHLNTRVKSETEKEAHFEKAVDLVRKAIFLDTTNTSAKELMAQLKQDYFQSLIDKGKKYYSKAGKTKNADLYFTAEYYLKDAQKFEADNAEIQSYLNKIKQKTLPVLNYREGVSLAIGGISRERKAIIIKIIIKNYTAQSVNIRLENFKLVDLKGNIYRYYEQEMQNRELFGETLVSNTKLTAANPSMSGIIAFEAPKDVKLNFLECKIDAKKSAKKYFP